MTSKLLRDNFTRRFKKLVAQADSIWLASAWITQNEALDALMRAKCDAKVLVGTHGNATDPQAIRSLIEKFGVRGVRIVDSEPLFHPKLYRFKFGSKAGKTIIWIGSANFTGGGLGGNRELMLQTDVARVAKEAEAWFDEVWSELPRDEVEAVLERYARRRHTQGVDRQLGQLVEPTDMPEAQVTLIRFQPTKGRGSKRYSGEMIMTVGRSRRRVPYTSATEALCKTLEALRQGRRSFLAKCSNDAAFVQPHRDGTTSQYLGLERLRIKEVRARRGDLGAKAEERITKTPIMPVRLAGEWWVSRDTTPKRVWTMIRAAANIADAKIRPNGSDPGF